MISFARSAEFSDTKVQDVVTRSRDETHDDGASRHYTKNLEFVGGTRGFAAKNASESGETRTLDPRIKSPVKS
jgi:hypothetical protein